ncbi:MAG: class I SAM-dependent methyltransferase [Dehalococcoidia bacterium]
MKDFYDPAVYDATTNGPPGDVDFYRSLAREAHEAGHPALELACGTGRVSIPIARDGIRVVGLDRSPAMLARAREKSADLANVRWVEGEMTNFDLPDRFGLVFIPARSFLHLLTVQDQLSCLRCIHRHLVADGRLAIDIFNPDIVMIAQRLTTNRGTVHHRSRYRHPRTDRSVRGWETTEYRPADQELTSTFIDEELTDDGAVISRIHCDLKLRYVFRYEMEHLLARAGFEVEALYGDHFGSAFDDTSPEMVWVARRPT